MIGVKLEVKLKRRSGFNGFRKERSTISAIRMIDKIDEDVNSEPYISSRFCAPVSLDVEGAFNSARWEL